MSDYIFLIFVPVGLVLGSRLYLRPSAQAQFSLPARHPSFDLRWPFTDRVSVWLFLDLASGRFFAT